jgi:putative FmdB family regulatory protein
MPLYEYVAAGETACPMCRDGFDVLQAVADAPLTRCPACGAPVRRAVSAAAVGRSRSGLDDRARSAGFHKLKRLGRGEYEKQY